MDNQPLYLQVKRTLLEWLDAGRYKPTQALPAEVRLAAEFGVSIGTLRRAVDELVLEQVLTRRQGKGTYVTQHNNERFLFQFFKVQERPEPGAATLTVPRRIPNVDLLGFESAAADEAEAEALRLRVGEKIFRVLNRLSLDRRPVAFDRISLPAGLFRGLTEKRLLERPGTLYSLYQANFGISVLRAPERILAVTADRLVARNLGVNVGVPLLQVHRIALTFGDRPVEYRVSHVHTQWHDYVDRDASAGRT